MSIRTPIPAAVTGGGISQDNVIFGMMVLAFVIYITMKGEFGTYLSFFAPSKTAAASSGSGSGTSALGNAVNNVATAVTGPLGIMGTINGVISNFKSILTGGGKVVQ